MAISFSSRRKSHFFSVPKEMRLATLFSVLLAATTGFVTIIFYTNMQPIIPLFYTQAQLDQQLAQKQFIFILPFIAIIFCCTNLIFGKVFSQIDIIMMKLLSWTTVFFEAFILFSLFRIIAIV